MERVETLLQKLNQQFSEGASGAQLMLTVQMLQHELAHALESQPASTKIISVSMPVNPVKVPVVESDTAPVVEQKAEPAPAVIAEEKAEPQPNSEGKIIQVLQIDEAEVEAELEEIKRNAATIQKITTQSKPQLLFEPTEDDIPTLVHQTPPPPPPAPPVVNTAKEINDIVATESTSVNDAWKETKPVVLSEKLTDAPVKDLKKAIGINDRFLYINELFRGDEAMYERSIKTINSFAIWPEAEYWIRRELKTKLGWRDTDETVRQFDQLVKRRFS